MASWRMLLLVEPPKYGGSPAGTSSATAIHQPAPATMPRPDHTTCRMRLPSRGGPAPRETSATPGTTGKACSILVRNANPISTPHSTSQRDRPFSSARTMAYAAIVSSSTSSASGLLNRNISAATGVSARVRPAISPAAGPNQRRTAAYRTPTEAIPSSACGTSVLQELTPKIRPEISITHSDAGVLSTVMKLEASNEPKKNAFQLLVPASTAAA